MVGAWLRGKSLPTVVARNPLHGEIRDCSVHSYLMFLQPVLFCAFLMTPEALVMNRSASYLATLLATPVLLSMPLRSSVREHFDDDMTAVGKLSNSYP